MESDAGRTGSLGEYNSVDFGKGAFQTLTARVESETGGTLQIREKDATGPVLAELKIPKGEGWSTQQAKAVKLPSEVHNVCAVLKGEGKAGIDWIRFQ